MFRRGLSNSNVSGFTAPFLQHLFAKLPFNVQAEPHPSLKNVERGASATTADSMDWPSVYQLHQYQIGSCDLHQINVTDKLHAVIAIVHKSIAWTA